MATARASTGRARHRRGFDLVTFTTDYGTGDGFAAACHGAVHAVAPHVRIIDVSHLVAPGDIRAGALLMEQTLQDLPVAVHVGVVDPGVGTGRAPVAITAARGDVLVGPDNGLLAWASDALGGATGAVVLADPRWHRPTVSRTFHGRDIFSPAAGHVAAGVDPSELGPALDPDALVRLPALRLASLDSGGVETEVRTVDRFGNVQLSARPADVAATGSAVAVGSHRIRRAGTFGDVELGELALIEDSAGYLAIAVNGGNAAQRLGLGPGDPVVLTPS